MCTSAPDLRAADDLSRCGRGYGANTRAIESAQTSASANTSVALGYVAEEFLACDRVSHQLASGLAAVARFEGFTLGRIYVEKRKSSPQAFGALVADLYAGSGAVVVPSLHHLAILDGGLLARRYLECITGVRVLVASSRSSATSSATASLSTAAAYGPRRQGGAVS